MGRLVQGSVRTFIGQILAHLDGHPHSSAEVFILFQ